MPRIRRFAATLAAAALAATALVVAQPAPPAVAAPADRVTGSWNMQGESQGGDGTSESRWRTGIQRMLGAEGVQVAALQEAGSAPPPSASWTDRVFPEPGVTEHLWNAGTSDRPDIVNIYWADTGQQRNGLAIVSRETARNAVELAVSGGMNSRPMMGVQFGNDWYFNAHALSMGGTRNDAEAIIETARQFMSRRPGEQWMVIGDFNYNPGRMPLNLQSHIVASNQPTHQGGSELDFAYSSSRNNNNITAERRAINSDHWWVRYALNPGCDARQLRTTALAQAAAECGTPAPGWPYRFFAQHLAGNVITRAGHIDKSGPTVTSARGDRNEAVLVRYSTEPGRYLLSFYSDECLTRQASGRVVLTTCRPDDEAQQWELTPNRIHSVGRGPELQPSPNEEGANLVVSTGMYQWRHEEYRPSEGHTELRKRDLRIMPLGDSITYGIGSSTTSSYRADLFGELLGKAKSVDFVGSQRSGQLPDRDNEGHSGAMISRIAEASDSSVPFTRPNVVALHAGTNDMDRGDPGAAPGRLGSLIDQVLDDAPGATVLVATLVLSRNQTTQSRITAYNEAVRDQVAKRRDAGRHVRLVDMSAVTTADLADYLHPNDSGYRKMADAFFDATAAAADDGWIKDPAQNGGQGCTVPGGWSPRGQIKSGEGDLGVPQEQVQFADVDGDGKDDYLVFSDGKWYAWHNRTSASTGPAWTRKGDITPFGLGFDSESVRFADIDGNGRDDFLVLSEDGSVRAAFNTDDGPEDPHWVHPKGQIASGVGATREQIRFADINGDGKDDYLVVSDKGAVNAWINTGGDSGGKPGWVDKGQVVPGPGVPAEQVQFADLTGDGNDDYLLVADNGAVKIWHNMGDGDRPTWLEQGETATGVGAPRDRLRFADLTGDKLVDYAAVSTIGDVKVWENASADSRDSRWIPRGRIVSGLAGEQVDFADINGDRRDDYLIVSGNGSVRARFNTSGGPEDPTWVHKGQIASGVGATREQIRFADVNGDGRDDYLVVADDGKVKAWLNSGGDANGNPGWIEKGQIASGVGATREQIRFADVNGDGRDDYLVVADDGKVKAWLNSGGDANGNPGWIEKGQIASGVGATREQIRFADVNGDGRDDYLVVADDGKVKAWLNTGGDANGNPGWIDRGQIASGVGATRDEVRFADINPDRQADYLVLSDTGDITAWQNNCGDPA